ncbi:GerAB/ArcD/ProY family transporter [Paenibacillus sp. y28]|uniref:GerAB/ArcD/ProY family transporter n=1 Tax=Paenibacillus sp. y28 TaxID=3129110 RepID=UPI0030164BB7
MAHSSQISWKQWTILLILAIIGDSILVLPVFPALLAGQDAWLCALAAMIPGLVLTGLFGLAASRFPGRTLVENLTFFLGKWFGGTLALIYIGSAILITISILREVSDFLTTSMMPETPIEAVHVLFMAIVIIAAGLGVPDFTRAGEILFPWFFILLLVLLMFLVPQFELEQVQPVLEGGIKPIMAGMPICIAVPYIEVVYFLMIAPMVQEQNKIVRGFILSALISGTILVLIIAACILVLGADTTTRQMYPTYELAQTISIGQFLERLEALLAIMWIFSTFVKTTVCFYAASQGIAQLMKLRHYRPLLLPMGLLIVGLTTLFAPNVAYYNEIVTRYWFFWDVAFSVMPVLFLLAAAAFRRKAAK